MMLYIIFLVPIIVGIIVTITNNDDINFASEKIEEWINIKSKNANKKSSKFSRFFLQPNLNVVVKFCDWTGSFSNRGLKNGIRVGLAIFLIAICLFIPLMATDVSFLIVVIYLMSIVLMVLSKEKTLDKMSSKIQERIETAKNKQVVTSEKLQDYATHSLVVNSEEKINLVQTKSIQNSNTMEYKIIPFGRSNDPTAQLQAIIDRETLGGFRYINHEYSDKLHPGSAGCFGIGAKPDTVNHVGFVVFGRE